MDNLFYLHLQKNKLAALPVGAFDRLARLRGLDLTGNALTTLPEGVLVPLKSLTRLSLKNNQLAKIAKGAFDGLAGLRGLDLSANQLAALPLRLFDGLPRLTELGLGENKLSSQEIAKVQATLPRVDIHVGKQDE